MPELVPLLKPSEQVITRLEELLAEARDGTLRGFAIVYLRTEGSFGEGWANLDEMGLINTIGSVACLQHRLMRRVQYPSGEVCGQPL